CPYAKGHFSRVNKALRELIEENDDITREVVERYAKRHTVCPFELSLDVTLWADAVICDYNYAFDPRVYLKRFFAQEDASPDCVFLVDEAHNLVDRAREMFSAELSSRAFSRIKTALKKSAPRLAKRLTEANKAFTALAGECIDQQQTVVCETLCEEVCVSCGRVANECEQWLKEHGKDHTQYDALLQLYFDCLAFIRTAELYDARYVTLIDCSARDVRVKLFCVDPSHLLDKALAPARGAALFSATLTPLDYYKEILGGREEDETLRLPSPFDAHNLHLLLCGGISTKYRDRDESYDSIARVIAATAGGRAGNYMVYFPSYRYLESVFGAFVTLCPEIPTIVQRQGMTEPEREQFLARFEAQSGETLIGFAVMGGAFSEGVDLQGERLIGTVIVGVGLAQINPEQDIVRDYFKQQNGMGFEYAYMYPGMNKVLQ
ncbi:MAG: ATP-dependent DNA helicase, partial [Acetanaerobacterium sp.]